MATKDGVKRLPYCGMYTWLAMVFRAGQGVRMSVEVGRMKGWSLEMLCVDSGKDFQSQEAARRYETTYWKAGVWDTDSEEWDNRWKKDELSLLRRSRIVIVVFRVSESSVLDSYAAPIIVLSSYQPTSGVKIPRMRARNEETMVEEVEVRNKGGTRYIITSSAHHQIFFRQRQRQRLGFRLVYSRAGA